jgi:sulfur-carrier protein
MKVRLKMFAILRERSGVSEASLELSDGATVAGAMEEAGRIFAVIAPLLPRSAAAVNRAYCEKSTVLHEGDELALIPPVGGG